jgi:hypothetical protein
MIIRKQLGKNNSLKTFPFCFPERKKHLPWTEHSSKLLMQLCLIQNDSKLDWNTISNQMAMHGHIFDPLAAKIRYQNLRRKYLKIRDANVSHRFSDELLDLLNQRFFYK